MWNRSEMVSLTLGNNIKTVRDRKRIKRLIFARILLWVGVRKRPKKDQKKSTKNRGDIFFKNLSQHQSNSSQTCLNTSPTWLDTSPTTFHNWLTHFESYPAVFWYIFKNIYFIPFLVQNRYILV